MKTLKIKRVKDNIMPKDINDGFANANITINSSKIDFMNISITFDETQYTDTQITDVINTIQGV